MTNRPNFLPNRYRKPGVKSHIQRLCEELPSHLRGGSTDAAAGARLVGYDTHVLASTLKMYLRQLPSALVPAELTSEALAVAQSLRDRAGPYTQDEACALLKPIIERMPEVNRATLGFMVSACALYASVALWTRARLFRSCVMPAHSLHSSASTRSDTFGAWRRRRQSTR